MEVITLKGKPIRVLIAKPGLDGHDRGAKVVAKALAETGMEVIYTGIRQTIEGIVNTAIQEDVDAIGLSSLAGAHNTLFPRIIDILKKSEMQDVIIFAGGIIPHDDAKKLKEYGVAEIFGPGCNTRDIIAFVQKAVQKS